MEHRRKDKSKAAWRGRMGDQINPENSTIFARPRHITDFQMDYRSAARYFPLTSKANFTESVETFRKLSKNNSKKPQPDPDPYLPRVWRTGPESDITVSKTG